jgi:diguanylate cyclase (GGDEF)-like protein
MSKTKWWKLLEQAFDPFVLVDARGSVVDANEAFLSLLKIAKSTLGARPRVTDLLRTANGLWNWEPGISTVGRVQALEIQVPGGRTASVQLLTVEADGELGQGGEPLYGLFLRDSSSETRLHEKYRFQLKSNEDLIYRLMRNVSEVQLLRVLSEVDLYRNGVEDIMERCERIGRDLLGWEMVNWAVAKRSDQDPEEVFRTRRLGSTARIALQFVWDRVRRDQGQSTAKGIWVEGGFWVLRVAPKLRNPVWVVIQPSREIESERDFFMDLTNRLADVIDNSALAKASITDPLTSLHNRRYFETQLALRVSEATEKQAPLTLLMFDVDRFKWVNDQHGHPVGDRVLQAIGKVVHDSVRDEDVVARIGGEEFMVLLPNTDAAGARVLADRIRNRVSELKVEIDPVTPTEFVSPTVSVGLSSLGGDINSAELLIESCDEAMYRAKGAGRNCVMQAA